MMKYTVRKANGNAGEFFFAYQIASILQWPCRLFDIDIGIDAQVEIINCDRTSTGKFVAFQIKASDDDGADYRYVSERQLAYWRDLDIPVFIVLIDLQNKAMYLHRISQDILYHKTRKGRIRIQFDLKKDIFSASSGKVISAAATEEASAHINKYLDKVQKYADNIIQAITSDFPDAPYLIELMDDRNKAQEELGRAESLVDAYKISSDEFSEISTKFHSSLVALAKHMKNYRMAEDWDENQTIEAFFREMQSVGAIF